MHQRGNLFTQRQRAKERTQKVRMTASQKRNKIKILRYILITNKEDYLIPGPNPAQCHRKMFMQTITPKNFITFSTDKAKMSRLSKEQMLIRSGLLIPTIQLKKHASQQIIQTVKNLVPEI